MRKFLTLALGLVFLASTTNAFAATNFRDNQYKIAIYDQRSVATHSEDGRIIDGVLACVYSSGTKTLATIYADNQRTARTNCITRAQFATDDQISFYAAASTVDLFVAHSDGSVARYIGITPGVHRLQIDRSGMEKVLVFPMVFNAGGTEVDTGLDLPKQSIVYDSAVEVITTDATETVDIGTLTGETNADPNGFIAAASVAVAGYVQPTTVTVGSNETYIAATTLGALLATISAGNDVATDVGGLVRKHHFVTGSDAVSVSYTPSSSDTFAGYGYVFFRVMR